MLKTKIYAMGNEGNFNYLIVSKNKDFFKWLTAILSEIKLDKPITHYEKEEGVLIKKNIQEFIDEHERYKSKDIRIDVFYGKDRIFIEIITSLENRRKIMKKASEYSIWFKPKPLKKW